MLKKDLIEENLQLKLQNTRLAAIVRAQMEWIVSIHEHYTATQRGLFTIVNGIDEARVDFKEFLAKMSDKIGAAALIEESTDVEVP